MNPKPPANPPLGRRPEAGALFSSISRNIAPAFSVYTV